jgi:hypothetical protein
MASAQNRDGANKPSIGPTPTPTAAAATSDSTVKAAQKTTRAALYRPFEINHIRAADQRGVNVFEAPKDDQVPFSGFALSFGGAFTQEFQGLDHQNKANAVMTGTPAVNANQLITIGHGFNNAVANLNVNAQLAPGIRVAMTSYLSARHHQETWVKDGYLLVDASPIDNPFLNAVMKYTTLRVGHFEINYGDSISAAATTGTASTTRSSGTTSSTCSRRRSARGVRAVERADRDARHDGRRSEGAGDGAGEADDERAGQGGL